MWALLRLPRFGGAIDANDHELGVDAAGQVVLARSLTLAKYRRPGHHGRLPAITRRAVGFPILILRRLARGKASGRFEEIRSVGAIGIDASLAFLP
jgi:hypothetical protein